MRNQTGKRSIPSRRSKKTVQARIRKGGPFAVLEAMNLPVSLIRPQYIYEWVNSCYAEGHRKKPEEIIGRTVASVWGEETFNNAIKGMLDRCFQGMQIRDKAWMLFPALGRRYCEVVYSPYRSHGRGVASAIVITYDITDRKEMEERLSQSEERFRHLSEASLEAIVFMEDGVIVDANKALNQVFGYEPEEDPRGRLAAEFIAPERRAFTEERIRTRTEGFYETLGLKKDGSVFPVEVNAKQLEVKRRNFRAVAVRDLTERKAAEERIRYVSFHDRLTDLYNRDDVEEELKRYDTPRELPLSLIIGDVNGLKLVNDLFGHQEGDLLLRKIADALSACCRKEDLVARWGGDEFVVLLPRTTEAHAIEFVRRVRKLCGETDHVAIYPSIALGVAVKEEPHQDLRSVMKAAEDRMYRNKLMDGKSARSAIIHSLQRTVQERSLEMGDHARRLKNMVVEVGRAIALPEDKLDELSLLAMFHDIGKIGVPDQILAKPGTLLPEEWEAMQAHLEIGYRIVDSTPELAHIGEALLAHHEWWDGTGYPRKLKSEQIPLIARILAIVDAYDVMTHDGPYRKAVSMREAIGELQECASTQFDPQLVDVFVQIMFSSHTA